MSSSQRDIDHQLYWFCRNIREDVRTGYLLKKDAGLALQALNKLSNIDECELSSLTVEFELIEQALSRYHHAICAESTSTQGILGLLKGLLVSSIQLAFMVIFPVGIPIWSLVVAPIIFTFEGICNAHKRAQKRMQRLYADLLNSLIPIYKKQLINKTLLMRHAEKIIDTDHEISSLRLPLTVIKQAMIQLLDESLLSLPVALRLHHTVNALVDALSNNQMQTALTALDALDRQVSKAVIKTHPVTMGLLLICCAVVIGSLAFTFLSGGSALPVALATCHAAYITAGCATFGLAIDNMRYQYKKFSLRKTFSFFKETSKKFVGQKNTSGDPVIWSHKEDHITSTRLHDVMAC